MKKYRGMMYPKNKRRAATKCVCTTCGKELTPTTAFYYVDGCNCAITENAPPFCYDCYVLKYGRR
jgi:hypothetical protein